MLGVSERSAARELLRTREFLRTGGPPRPVVDAVVTDLAAWDLLDAAPDGIIVVDEFGRILLVNRQTEDLFGYDRSDLVGRPVDDLLPERLRHVHRAHRTRYRVESRRRSMGAGMTLLGRRADGSEFPVEVSLSPIETDDGLRVLAAVRDITDRTELEAEARSVRETLDAIGDGVLIFDADTLCFTHVNQGAIKQVGYEYDELLGMTMLHIAPEFDEGSLRALLEPLERGELSSTTFTTVHRHRDGTDLPVEITLEARRDGDGVPRTYIEIARDITAWCETEELLRRTEQDLRVVEDRERIARDLHDLTIQRLFAAGVTLQAAQSRCHEESIAASVGIVITDLDDTIRELRSVIFGLHAHANGSELRDEILRVVTGSAAVLRFAPSVRFVGLIDTISDAIATELLATLHEALSNVSRHAKASSVEVVVECNDSVALRVFDDGHGVGEDAVGGSGISNLTARAVLLGGVCRVEARPHGGTMLEWLVPNALPANT